MAERFRRQIYISTIIFVFLCCVYLLTYRGLLSSIDELVMFGMAESLARHGSLDVPQLGFARYHNRVGLIEPLQPLMAAPLVWLALHIDGVGNVQAVLLFNVVVTALTGGLLYLLLCGLDFSPAVGVTTVLLFGLATVAWPYARTFFREPLTGLWLLGATWGMVRWQRSGKKLFGVLMLLGLGLALLTKITSALAWPAFVLFWVIESGARKDHWRQSVLLGLVVLIGLAVGGVLCAQRQLWDILRPWSNLAVNLGETVRRLVGLTVGAGRGLFLFSPVLGLALPGLLLMWSQRRVQAMFVGGLLLCSLLGYSQYPAWHGGLSWGSRFLVPIVPVLCVAVAGWLEWLVACRRLWAGLLTALLSGVSVAIQLAASTGNASWVAALSAWDNLIDYARSPALLILVYWRPVHFDMLWWHGPLPVHLEHVYCNPWIALLPTGGVCAAAVLLWGALRGRAWAGRWAWGGTVAWLVGAVGVLLWQAPQATHGYPGVNPAELRRVAEIVNRDRNVPHTIVTVSNDFHLNVLLNYFKGRFVHHWLSPLQADGFETLLDTSTDVPGGVHRLSLIVDRVHIPPEVSGHEAELWLNARLHRYMVDWVGGGYEVYSYLYPPAEMPLQAVDYRWTPGMVMSAVGLTPRAVRAGDPIWLEFHCSAAHKIEGRYDVFVQFLSPDGRYVNGTDGPPQFGAAMTSWWRPGDVVIDRRAFFVPADAAPGTYRVIAGFYVNGERLPVFDAHGTPLGTHVELGGVQVH